MLRRLVGDDVPEDLAVGFVGSAPGHLEAVHRDLGEAEVGGRAGDPLQRPRAHPPRLRPLARGVEGGHGDGVVLVHVEEDEGVGGVGSLVPGGGRTEIIFSSISQLDEAEPQLARGGVEYDI